MSPELMAQVARWVAVHGEAALAALLSAPVQPLIDPEAGDQTKLALTIAALHLERKQQCDLVLRYRPADKVPVRRLHARCYPPGVLEAPGMAA